MGTLVTRKGKTSIHQLRKLWRERDAVVEMTIAVSAEDRERIAREDAEIQRRREAFPLH